VHQPCSTEDGGKVVIEYHDAVDVAIVDRLQRAVRERERKGCDSAPLSSIVIHCIFIHIVQKVIIIFTIAVFDCSLVSKDTYIE
jgi:hypothetical protein